MAKRLSRLCIVFFVLSFAPSALSDRDIEEQKTKLLNLIVESKDPEVRKKLLLIYENLDKNNAGIPDQPKVNKFSGSLTQAEVKQFRLLLKSIGECRPNKKIKAKFGKAGNDYLSKTSGVDGRSFEYSYAQLRDSSMPSTKEIEIHRYGHLINRSCIENIFSQASARCDVRLQS